MRRDKPISTGKANPHSSALRKHRFSIPGHLYHLVKCLDTGLRRQVDLTDPAYAEIIINALFHQRDRNGCRLFAFVVMPDHVHWLLALPETGTLTNLARILFNWCAIQINRQLGRKGSLWQDGYYDHLVCENETLSGLIRYIEANPVRKELCLFSADWLWSSAHSRWQGKLDRGWLGRGRFEEGRGA